MGGTSNHLHILLVWSKSCPHTRGGDCTEGKHQEVGLTGAPLKSAFDCNVQGAQAFWTSDLQQNILNFLFIGAFIDDSGLDNNSI